MYLCTISHCDRDAKDNALMTPLMNSVASNHDCLFVYLHFKENNELGNIDINGNTLLHLAARANSINVAKLL